MSSEESLLTGLMAVFEGEFSIDWILEISGCKATDLLGIIDELNKSGMIESRRPGVYYFKDSKKRLQIYEDIDPEKRDVWHRSISEILFRDIPNQRDAVIRASVHLLHLANDEKDWRHLLDAGDLYRKVNQYQKALGCYLKIIHDLDNSDSEEAYRILIRAIIGYTKLFMVDSDIGAAVALIEKAIVKAQKRNRIGDAALIKMNLALIEWTFADIDTAIGHFNEGWAMAQAVNDPRLRGSSFLFNSFFMFIQGRIRDVVENYEQIHSDIDRYPTNRFPLMAANTIATCYAYNGEIQRGVAMLEGLFDQYRNKEDAYSSCYTGLMIGSVFIEMGQLDEAIQHLEFTLGKAIEANSNTHISLINLKLAFAHYRKNNVEKSLEHLRASVKLRRQKNLTNKYHTYHGSELFWAMDLGDYPVVKELSISEEVNRELESKNILIKGIAYRYRSLMDERDGVSRKSVLKWMLGSEALLEESGHELQLARTRMQLARIYLSIGDEKKAKEVIQKSSELLNSFMQSQVPDNLRFLLKDLRTDKNLLEEIMKLGQDLVAIPNFRDLLRQILAAVNQITGAERGAVFLLNGTEKKPEVVLRAARNLTAEDIERPDFFSSMEMIRVSITSGKPQIYLSSPPVKIDLRKKKDIHSRICVPLKIRQKTIGVLYVDNRIFTSAFKESDIRILNFFSSAAAIALENTQIREENELLRQRLETENAYRRPGKE